MKSFISPIVFLFLFSPLYSQIWKQYADSAKTYSDQKNTNKAIEFYSRAIGELKKDSVGTKSYATLSYALGNLYRTIGQYEKAEPLYVEARQILEKVLGKQHADYARSCNALGSLYFDRGQYEKAEALYLEARQILEKVLGKLHPDYIGSCNNLGNLYLEMGQYGKAEPLYVEAKQGREKVLGKEHPDYPNLARILYTTL